MAIPNLATGVAYAIHMRCPSSSGGKDWVGAVTTTGEIHTYWGKTGNIGQHAAKQGSMTKLQSIISEKLAKGYVQVDDYDPNRGWDSKRTSAPPQAAATPNPAQIGPPVNLVKTPAVAALNIPTQVAETAPLIWDF